MIKFVKDIFMLMYGTKFFPKNHPETERECIDEQNGTKMIIWEMVPRIESF